MIGSLAAYTKFVKSTKVLLGIFVILIIAVILFYPIIQKSSNVRIAFNNTEKSETSPTKMTNASFRGFDSKNQPFNITAVTATQIDNNTIEFNQISGDIVTNSEKWINIKADKGVLQINQKLLYLTNNVQIFNEEGYELRTNSLNFDIGKKLAITNEAVDGQWGVGVIKSVGANFDGEKQIYSFHKPVFVKLFLPKTKSK